MKFWKSIYAWQFEFKLADMWIGAYWRRERYVLHIWVCLLPCLPLHIVVLV